MLIFFFFISSQIYVVNLLTSLIFPKGCLTFPLRENEFCPTFPLGKGNVNLRGKNHTC